MASAGAMIEALVQSIIDHGDIGHLALLLWATTATALLYWTLRELAAATRRFDDFVRELARFNSRFTGHP